MPPKDPEARRAYMRAWREKNRDKARENQKRYQERNQERIKEYQRQYYLENREQILAKEKAYREGDPEAYRKRKREDMRRWREADPEAYRARQRRHWAKQKYGLTLEELEAIIARGCAICGVKEDPQRGNRRHGRLCIDHDHTDGKIRDALCHGCNTGLGSFGDDPDRLEAAAAYLRSHQKGGLRNG